MDFSRIKRAVASVSVAALALTQAGTAFAAYSDVPSGVWYEEAVSSLLADGYLDASQPRFRGGDLANRAEFVKLVVELNGGILSTPPAVPSFNDVPTDAWFYGYMEEAGKEGWVRGDGDCYGSSPCYARPGANINRAEASALIVRSFNLEPLDLAPQFVDNPNGQWYTDVVQTAADYCVLQGDDGSGAVRPGDNMNRAEMATMLYRVDQGLTYGLDCGDVEEVEEPMLTDVVATSATSVEVEFNVALDEETAEDVASYMVTCDAADVPVTSAELVDIDLVELTLGSSVDAGADCVLDVDAMWTDDGWEFFDSMGFSGYSPIVTGDGVLEVSLSASNPVTDTVPQGSVGVVMLSADLTASCDDSVIVEDVTILHEGFGDEQDIDGVYAAIDGARVSRKRTIDSEDQTAELRFSSPLVIDNCETVTVDVVADFNTGLTAASEHNLVLELSSDIVSNALDVQGNFPLRGNTFRIAAVTSGEVEVDYRTVTPNEVEVGDTGVVIGKFEVSVNSVEDQTFYSMTLEQNSSASDGDFVNIAIRRTDGTVLTNTVTQSIGDFVTLVFDPPFTVLEGDKITLEVIADIVGGAGDAIVMHFEETSDIFSVGSLYGYGVNGQLYGSQISIPQDDADSVNIDAGEFRVGIDGPAGEDYTRDDNDAILANIEFETGGEKVDVKDMFIAIEAETATGGILCSGGGSAGTTATCATAPFESTTSDDQITQLLEDVEIRNTVTGRTIDGVVTDTNGVCDLTTTCTNRGTFQVYRFDDFIIHGEEVWEFRVDFIDNGAGLHPLTGDEFTIHICGESKNILNNGALATNTTGCDFAGLLAGGTNNANTSFQMDVEGLSTGDAIGDVRPGNTITGNAHRIANATLSIGLKGIKDFDTTVEQANDVRLLKFEARAGEAEAILLTKAVFEAAHGDPENVAEYILLVDGNGDGEVDTVLEDGVSEQNGLISFDELVGGGTVIPAEETVIFEVHGNIASSLVDNEIQIRFASGTNLAVAIEAEELDDGSNLSGVSLDPNTGGPGCASSSCDIILTTDGELQTRWTLVGQGDLFVQASEIDSDIGPHQLLGGEKSEPVLRLEFFAQNEDIDVTDIDITSSGSLATTVKSLDLYVDGETEPFTTAETTNCGTDTVLTANPRGGGAVKTFCARMDSEQLIVGEDDYVEVLIRANIHDDDGAGTNGLPEGLVQFFIGSGQTITNTQGAIRADGAESDGRLDANDQDGTYEGEIFIGNTNPANPNQQVVGEQNVVVYSKITEIVDASDDNPGDPVPFGPESVIGEFEFFGADHVNENSASLSGVVFTVTATNVVFDPSEFAIYRLGSSENSKKVACDAFNGATNITNDVSFTGSLTVVCGDLITNPQRPGGGDSDFNPVVPTDGSISFFLESDIDNPQAGGQNSTLQVSIRNFNEFESTAFGNGANDSHLAWFDDSTTQVANDELFLWIESDETTVKSTSYSST